MKKRLIDGEIETAKKTSRIMVTVVTIILVLLVIVIAYVAYLYEAGKLFTNEKGEIVIKNEPTKDKEIEITDTNILSLLNTVAVTKASCDDGEYLKDKVEVKNLSDRCKFELAKNKYIDYVKYDYETHITYINENKVKDVYQSLFGNNSYQRQETIPYATLNDLMFDARYNHYFMNDKAKEIDSSLKGFEKIKSVEKKKNDLYIISNVLYYESTNNVICIDSRCEKVLEVLSKDNEYNDDYFDLYLEHNKDKLDKYKYHFTLNDIGFYEYQGYEKTS